MRRLTAGPRLRLLAVFAGSLLVTVPPHAYAGVPLTLGHTESYNYGGEFEFVQQGAPDGIGRTSEIADQEWSIDIVNAPTWTFDETRSIHGTTATGIAFEAVNREQAGLELETETSGDLTRFHASGTLSSRLRNAGEAGTELDLNFPFRVTADTFHVTATYSADVQLTGDADAAGEVSINIFCTEGDVIDGSASAYVDEDTPPEVESTSPIDLDVRAGSGQCTLQLSASTSAEKSHGPSFVENGISSSGTATFEITVTADAGPCVLSGIVSTGIAGIPAADHGLRGIAVELLDDDDAVVGRAVSDRDGRYCFRDIARAGYAIRASLVDADHDPPIFRTVHFPSTDDIVTEGTVVEDDFGRDDFGIDFRPTDSAPWRAEVAAIHRESMRFVSWLIEAGIASAAELGTFTIQSDSDQGTSYDDVAHEIRIQVSDTRYDERRNGWSQCPENCEWHEIGHHLEDSLGFAESDSEPCNDREPHAGWANPTSCDSFVEGFASFISTYGSLTIDAGREPPYATDYYSVFGSFERNTDLPFQVRVRADGTVVGWEDHGVAQLLWDLVDDSAAEEGLVSFFAADGGQDFTLHKDAISLDGTAFIRMLEATTPQTVAELRDVLVASDLISDAQKVVTVDINEDGQPDVSALDAVFLIHAFHPVADITKPFYRIGDPVGRTDRQPVDPSTGRPFASSAPATEQREHMPLTPGAGVRLENPRATDSTFTIAITYPGITSQFEVVVPAHGNQVVGLELPPYWTAVNGTGLPACGAADHRLVAVKVTVAGQAPLDLDNCTYWHAIETATGASAVTYSSPSDGSATPVPAGTGPPTPSPTGDASSTGIVVVAAIAVVVLLGAAALFVVRRNRGRGAPTG